MALPHRLRRPVPGGELPWFVSEARTERADAVIGFRPRRADPTMRKVNAWLWTRAAQLLLGVGATGRRLRLQAGRQAGARRRPAARRRGAHLARTADEHPGPRARASCSGRLSTTLACTASRPAPSCRSSSSRCIGLLGLWLNRMREAPPGRAVRAVVHPRDVACVALTVAAAVVSVVAYLAFAAQHVLLAYPETVRGLLIARRMPKGLSPRPGARLGLAAALAPADRRHRLERHLVLLGAVRQRALDGRRTCWPPATCT